MVGGPCRRTRAGRNPLERRQATTLEVLVLGEAGHAARRPHVGRIVRWAAVEVLHRGRREAAVRRTAEEKNGERTTIREFLLSLRAPQNKRACLGIFIFNGPER